MYGALVTTVSKTAAYWRLWEWATSFRIDLLESNLFAHPAILHFLASDTVEKEGCEAGSAK